MLRCPCAPSRGDSVGLVIGGCAIATSLFAENKPDPMIGEMRALWGVGRTQRGRTSPTPE